MANEKVISLSNLARFKGKCDGKYKLYKHDIQLNYIASSAKVSFTLYSSKSTAHTIGEIYSIISSKTYTPVLVENIGTASEMYCNAIQYISNSSAKILRCYFSLPIGGDIFAYDEYFEDSLSENVDNVLASVTDNVLEV